MSLFERPHFDLRVVALEAFAQKLKPDLEIDRAGLHVKGFTPALNAAELSVVIEAAILELYSSIECAAIPCEMSPLGASRTRSGRQVQLMGGQLSVLL